MMAATATAAVAAAVMASAATAVETSTAAAVETASTAAVKAAEATTAMLNLGLLLEVALEAAQKPAKGMTHG